MDVFLSCPLAQQYCWIQIAATSHDSFRASGHNKRDTCISLLYLVHEPNNRDYIPKHYMRLFCTLNWFICGCSVHETGLLVGLGGGAKM
jgi:hypothetical protein